MFKNSDILKTKQCLCPKLFNQINLRKLFSAFPYAKRVIFIINSKAIANNLKKEKIFG